MSATSNEQPGIPEIPEDRRFVWRNLEAYLAGTLCEPDRKRIENFLCECPNTREYVETERQLIQLLRRCMDEPEVACPDGLRERVCAALERSETDEPDAARAANTPTGSKRLVLGFPWLGAGMLVAASIMLVVAVLLLFGRSPEPAPISLPGDLAPLVASVSMDVPQADRCRYRDALDAYRRHFADGPALPHEIHGYKLKVSEWHCAEIDGRRVMCATYDAPDGHRFGLVVFRCNCLEKAAPKEMKAVEVELNGQLVLLWREGDYFRGLVGHDAAVLRRHMDELRQSA
ncbi:MAG: hypothetical protein H6841_11530 [Planctomycetes bacterium]|nr:hypothetical protein [Planctomycetota bacterium]MCB9935082.1 hypothetical protein [Planctomycetota bacterium]